MKKNYFKVFLFLTGCVFHSQFSLFSQNLNPADSIKTVSLSEVIISASRDSRNVADVPKSVSVIPVEKINKQIYSSVGDLLSREAGIQLIGGGQNFGASQTMFIRGANSNHSIVMLDGVRIYDPSTVDNGIDLSELSLNNIDRIEIVEGPLSTLYGSSAIGGIINIITGKKSDKPVQTGISMKGGVFGKNTFDLNSDIFLNLNHKSGIYLNMSANVEKVNGMNTIIDTISDTSKYHHPDNDDFSKIDLYAKAGYKMKNTDLYVAYSFGDQKSDLDKGAYRDDDNRYITFRRELINYGANYSFSKNLGISLIGGYSVMKRTDVDDSSVISKSGTYDHQYAKTVFDGSYLNNDLLVHHKIKNVSSVIGFQNTIERMSNYSYIYSYDPYFGEYESENDLDTLNLEATTIGLFFHSDVNMAILSQALSKLTIGVGARITDHSRFGRNVTYEVNPSYKTGNSLIYFNYSTGFNAPSLYRLYTPDKAYGAYTTRGNPDLKAETSSNIEIGFKQYLSKETNFTVSWYHTVIDNVIEYVYLWDKNIGIDTLGNDWMRNDFKGDTYINLSKQTVNGLEFGITSKISKQLGFFGNINLISGTTEYSSDDIDTVHTGGNHVQLFESGIFISENNSEVINLTRRPNAIANIGISFQPIKKLTMVFTSRFIGAKNDVYFNPSIKPYGAMDRELLAAYNVSDLQLTYEFSKSLLAMVKIENIFDTEYQEIAGFSCKPRGVFLKISYSY